MTTTHRGGHPAQEIPGSGRFARQLGVHRALVHLREPRRPFLAAELLLIAVAYGVYSLIRDAVPAQESAAIQRGFQLWQLERDLYIDVELWINRAVDGVQWLVVSMNYFYATMHFVVTAAVLAWLYVRHPGRYRAARTVLAITTGLALFGYFLYPLAPPRLLPESFFIDTVRVHGTWGSLASGDLQNLSNQYAAMPSMHAGWSLWCGIMIVLFARSRWTQTLGVLYPLVTLVVIMATANHFILDAVGGWLTLGAGFALQWRLHGRPAHAYSQQVAAAT